MEGNQSKVVIWIMLAAAILAMIAAFIPVLKGGPLNVAGFGAGVVFFVLAAAAARKARTKS